jgi:hypothetical protein
LFFEGVSNSLEMGSVYDSPGRTLDYKIEVVRCNRYDGIWITRNVPGFAGSGSSVEIECIVYE